MEAAAAYPPLFSIYLETHLISQERELTPGESAIGIDLLLTSLFEQVRGVHNTYIPEKSYCYMLPDRLSSVFIIKTGDRRVIGFKSGNLTLQYSNDGKTVTSDESRASVRYRQFLTNAIERVGERIEDYTRFFFRDLGRDIEMEC